MVRARGKWRAHSAFRRAARAHLGALLLPPPPPRRADPDSGSDSVLLKRDFFFRREWNFTMADDVFIRYLCFRDADELSKAIQQRQPHKIDIGPVFSAKPSDHNKVQLRPEERELIFDIDMDAYDDIRTCCKGAKLCGRCWQFINAAVKVLDTALRDDFGFRHVLFVYSGRRGMHCWVSDEAARKLDNPARGAVAEYLSALTGGGSASVPSVGGADGGGGGGRDDDAKSMSIARTTNSLTLPLHPALMCVEAALGVPALPPPPPLRRSPPPPPPLPQTQPRLFHARGDL